MSAAFAQRIINILAYVGMGNMPAERLAAAINRTCLWAILLPLGFDVFFGLFIGTLLDVIGGVPEYTVFTFLTSYQLMPFFFTTLLLINTFWLIPQNYPFKFLVTLFAVWYYANFWMGHAEVIDAFMEMDSYSSDESSLPPFLGVLTFIGSICGALPVFACFGVCFGAILPALGLSAASAASAPPAAPPKSKNSDSLENPLF